MTQHSATNFIRNYTHSRFCSRPLLADRMFYGWLMIPVAMAAMICSSPAQTYGISVFTPHLRATLNLSHAQLAGAYALGTLLAAAPLTWFGLLMDRYGIRKTMSAIVILATGACWLMSQVQGLFTVFLGFFTLRMFGQSAMMLLTANILPQWFNRRLGLASGIFALAPATAIASAPIVAVWLINTVGWRGAYLVFGLGISVVMLPLLGLVHRNRPEDIGQQPDGLPDPTTGVSQPGGTARAGSNEPLTAEDEPEMTLKQALCTRAYWIMILDTGFGALSKTAISYSVVSLFISRGFDQTHAASQAATLFLVFGITLGVVRLLAGYLADHVPLNLLLLAATTFAASFMFCIWQAQSTWMIGLCGGLMGLQQGTKGAVATTLFRRYYGRANLGRIKGSFMTAMVAASAMGPLLVDGLYDWVGSYGPILGTLAVLSLPLLIVAPFATPPQRARTVAT